MVLGFISNKLLTSGSHTVYPIMHQRLGASNLSRVALKSLNPEEVVIRKVHLFHKGKYRVEGANQLWQ